MVSFSVQTTHAQYLNQARRQQLQPELISLALDHWLDRLSHCSARHTWWQWSNARTEKARKREVEFRRPKWNVGGGWLTVKWNRGAVRWIEGDCCAYRWRQSEFLKSGKQWWYFILSWMQVKTRQLVWEVLLIFHVSVLSFSSQDQD